LSAAWVAQEVVASFSHFVMKLLSAAPASFLSDAWLLHVASCAKAVAANVESSAASNIFFIESSSIVCRHESLPSQVWWRGGYIREPARKSSDYAVGRPAIVAFSCWSIFR